MRKTFVVLVVVFAALLLGCQGTSPVGERSLTAATCQQDVIDAWNMHCAVYHFDSIPAIDATLMGHVYRGDCFDGDSEAFMSAIQSELLSTLKPPAEIDDTLNEILDNPVWYE